MHYFFTDTVNIINDERYKYWNDNDMMDEDKEHNDKKDKINVKEKEYNNKKDNSNNKGRKGNNSN
eukprot:4182714-Ditylum_brightwellii.AAC.1